MNRIYTFGPVKLFADSAQTKGCHLRSYSNFNGMGRVELMDNSDDKSLGI